MDSRELKKIDSTVGSIEITRFDYDDGNTNRYTWTYNITYYDHNWRPTRENMKRSYYTDSKISEDKIDYIRDVNGLLLQKNTHWDGNEGEPEKWSYDKNGNCIVHSRGENLETWDYDEKGNVVKYKAGDRENRFKIYYK